MDLTLNIKEYGENNLKVVPDPNSDSSKDVSRYIVVYTSDDIKNPYLILDLKGSHFVIVKQRDIEEPSLTLSDKLDDLALRVNEAIQNGDDLSAVTLSHKPLEKPYNPDEIRVEPKNFSLRQIYDMINDGDLDLSPDFQRNVVWDQYRKSRLIESILLRIPLPMFYFSQDDEGKLYVVDGLQRLTAIKEFMDNKLELHNLEYLSNSCDGKTYNKKENGIEDKYYRWFNLTQIMANVIDPRSPAKVKYDIFRRINTGGRPLNSQELRNSLSRNDLRKALRQMVALPSFKKATGGSIKDVRMDAQEISLRFLYFRWLYKKEPKEMKNIDKYSGDMDSDLDDFVDLLHQMKNFDFGSYVLDFDISMKNAYYLFGKHAFRKVEADSDESSARSVINKALFVSWSVLLADYPTAYVKSKLKQYALVKKVGNEIDNDRNYFYYLSYGTNGKGNILYAFKKANAILKEVL